VEAIGIEKFKTSPVGTGPFVVEKYLPKEKVIFTRHSAYFRGAPILTKVQGMLMADVAATEMALIKGELQAMVGPMEETWVNKMEANKGILVDVFGPGEDVNLHYNIKKPPLDSIDARKAIAYAISRKEMIGLFGAKIATPTYSPIPVGLMAGGLSNDDLKKAGIDWKSNRMIST